jgi:prevent-host-death family protein
MTDFSVADAKNNLPRLIDRALAGEEVVITRRGKPVAEIRPLAATARSKPAAGEVGSTAWLRARRDARAPINMTALEVLAAVYEDYRY